MRAFCIAAVAAALAAAAPVLAQTGAPQTPLIPPAGGAAVSPAAATPTPPTPAAAAATTRPRAARMPRVHHAHWHRRAWRFRHAGRSERVAEQLNIQELQRIGVMQPPGAAPPPR